MQFEHICEVDSPRCSCSTFSCSSLPTSICIGHHAYSSSFLFVPISVPCGKSVRQDLLDSVPFFITITIVSFQSHHKSWMYHVYITNWCFIAIFPKALSPSKSFGKNCLVLIRYSLPLSLRFPAFYHFDYFNPGRDFMVRMASSF